MSEKTEKSENIGNIETGRIIKGVGGFYTVLSENGETCVCKARGLFRKQEVTPVVGDMVEYALNPIKQNGEKTGYLLRISERKNMLIRPAVSNIDKLAVVVAASRPQPDLLLVDKLLVVSEKFNIQPIIVINKCDEGDKGEKRELAAEYGKTGYPLHFVSAATGEGLSALFSELSGATICLAGQSAVGKSSLLNALFPGLGLAVGGLSEKTERGRHTTRHTSLIPIMGGGAVLDTPGFSLLETLEIEPEELRLLYPELRGAEKHCRFTGCLHLKEPGCHVKTELIFDTEHDPMPNSDGIHKKRYERYIKLVEEANEQRRHKYD